LLKKKKQIFKLTVGNCFLLVLDVVAEKKRWNFNNSNWSEVQIGSKLVTVCRAYNNTKVNETRDKIS